MKVFVKDFCKTRQAKKVIFGTLVDNDVCIVGLQTSFLIFILLCICPIFFLSIFQIMKVFIKDFCETVPVGGVIFCMQDDNDVLRDGEPAFSCLFFPAFVQFSFFPYFE